MRVSSHLRLIVLCASISRVLVGAEPTGELGRSAAASDNQNNRTVLQGSVLDANGQPLASVEINAVVSSVRPIYDPQAGSRMVSMLAKATTDQQGRFQVDVRRPKPTDDISVFAYPAGHSVAWCFVKPSKDTLDGTVRANQGIALVGTVRDPQGRPIPGVAVKLCAIRSTAPDVDPWFAFLVPPEALSAWPRPAITRDDGTFALDGISPRTEVLLEIDDERVARQKWKVLVEHDVAPVTIDAQPSRIVEGRVVLGDLRVPAAATVVLTSWNKNDQHFGAITATTDVHGHFSVRPFAGDRLDIRVVPSGNTTYQSLHRSIPWPSGTTTQRMVLTLHEKGWKSMDGTTRDGRLASTIDADYPTVKVERCQPTKPLSDKLSGTILASASVTTSKGAAKATFDGLIAIEPNSGRWHVIVEGGLSPRVSPDGRYVAYGRIEPSEVNVLSLQSGANPRRVAIGAAGSVGLAVWGTNGQSLLVSVSTPAQRDYYGEEYWGQEEEVWKIDSEGVKQQQIPIPPLYGLHDMSHDGKSIVMHWDTHASATGAQLYIAKTDGSALRPVARKKSQYYWYPRFHPTDKTVCAKHVHAITHDRGIHVIAVDGSQERSITLPDRHDPETACWSPDGRFLAIPSIRLSAMNSGPKIGPLFIVDESGTHFRQVALENVVELRIYNVEWTAADLFPR